MYFTFIRTFFFFFGKHCSTDWCALLNFFRHGEPDVVVMLVLAESADATVLVEVRAGGAAAPRPGAAGAVGLSPALLGLRRSCCVAPQHRASAFPFLQVTFPRACTVCCLYAKAEANVLLA